MEDIVDQLEILLALWALKPGESMVYHEGFLDDDRMPQGRSKHPWHTEINAIANEAYEGYLKGELELTQRRLGPPVKDKEINWYAGIGPGFAYIATRRMHLGSDKRDKKVKRK